MAKWKKFSERPGFYYKVRDGKIAIWDLLSLYPQGGNYVVYFGLARGKYVESELLKKNAKEIIKAYDTFRNKLNRYGIGYDDRVRGKDKKNNQLYGYGQDPAHIKIPVSSLNPFLLGEKEIKKIKEEFIGKYYDFFRKKCDGADIDHGKFEERMWKFYVERLDKGDKNARPRIMGYLNKISKMLDKDSALLDELARSVGILDSGYIKKRFWEKFWEIFLKKKKEHDKAAGEAFYHILSAYTLAVGKKNKRASKAIEEYVKGNSHPGERNWPTKVAILTLSMLLAYQEDPIAILGGTSSLKKRADEIYQQRRRRFGL